jgi:hypothetical protein
MIDQIWLRLKCDYEISMRLFKQKWPKNLMKPARTAKRPHPNRFFKRFTALNLLLGTLLTNSAWAQLAPQNSLGSKPQNRWWITPGAVSYHFENQDEFNQTHPGLGVEYLFAPEWAAVGGTYKNSNNLWSKYAGVNWTPQALRFGPFKLGATAQVADNYKAARNGKPFAFAAPLIAVEGERFGANIYIIPTIRNVTGAVALQLKIAL